DSLHWILIVVETGCAEREVEIYNDGVEREIACDGPGDVMRHGGRTDPAFRADDRDHSADGHCLGCGEQAANRPHDIKGIDRSNDVIVDTAPHQFAIGRDIVLAADDDHTCSGIAHGCKLIETSKNIATTVGLQNDDDWRRD